MSETATAGPRQGWWRTLVCTVLLVVVVILAPLSVLAVWTHRQVSDSDYYVSTVTPLASDPAVQEAAANRISTLVLEHLDVSGLLNNAIDDLAARGLPPRAATGLKALSNAAETAVQNFVHDTVLRVVQSDAFKTAWIEANRQAHLEMVKVLTGQGGGSVQVQNGEVRVSLAAFLNTVKSILVQNGFQLASRIPTVDATFVIFNSADLQKAQTGFHLLDLVATVLPVLTLLLIVIAVLLAKSRRKAIIASGLCVAGGMVLLGLILAIVRPLYLDALPPESSRPAASAIFDTLVSFLRMSLRGILVLALAIAFVAWVLGPTGAARRVRTGVGNGVGFVRNRPLGRLDTGAFGHGLWELRTPLRIAIVAGGLLYLLLNNPITGIEVIWTIVVVALLLVVVELLARPPVAASPEPQQATPGGDPSP